jgi:hypothetical protein
VGTSEAGDGEWERARKVVVEEERKDGVRDGTEMGSGRREGRTHTGRARESSRVVLWASETRGRTAEPKLCSVSGGQEAVECAGSQRFAHAESARVCVACIELEAVVCGWSRKGEEGEGSREKEQGTRDKGRGTRAS